MQNNIQQVDILLEGDRMQEAKLINPAFRNLNLATIALAQQNIAI